MVKITKLIIDNIKEIRYQYLFYLDIDLDTFLDNIAFINFNFDNNFIQEIINLYEEKRDGKLENNSYSQNEIKNIVEYEDEIFGKFIKKIKNYLNHLIEIENKMIELNSFFENENICTSCINAFYKLNHDNELSSSIFDKNWK
jgi:hypothetical protein